MALDISQSDLDLIDSFVNGTPKWIDSLRPMRDVQKSSSCLMCGCPFEDIKKVAEIVKLLKLNYKK